MLYRLSIFLLLFSLSFAIPKQVSANLSFTPTSTAIKDTDELEVSVNLSLSGQANKNYFLEGAFSKPGTTSYFGLTWNDYSWVKYVGGGSGDFDTLKLVTTDQGGNWSGLLKVKIDKESGAYTGSGEYVLKIKRFTQGGSYEWSENAVNITVTASPTQTDTPTPQPSTSAQGSTTSTSGFLIASGTSRTDSDKSFKLTLNLSGLEAQKKYYLKAAFFKEGSTNYFGLTWVSGSFVKNSAAFTDQLEITTDANGSFASDIEVMADSQDTGYSGSGEYNLKIGRYTEGGSGPAWSNVLGIYINNVAILASPGPVLNPTISPKNASQSGTKTSDTAIPGSSYPGTNLPNYSPATPSAKSLSDDTDSLENPGRYNYFFVGAAILALGAGSTTAYKVIRKRNLKRSQV